MANHQEKPSERLSSISSKYSNIGGLEKEAIASPGVEEKNALQQFEKKYLKPIFTKQENEDLEITYSLPEEKKVGTDRRMELLESEHS
jgi:pantothenate kinase type III